MPDVHLLGRLGSGLIPVILASYALAGAGCDGASRVEGNGTSIVLIVVDTLRADHMSLYGHSLPTTPQLAGWARRGVTFERAFATSPWTLPSFASIYTGQLPSRHGAGAIVPEPEGDPGPPGPGTMIIHGKRIRFTGLDEDVTTLAEIFREAGYATGAVVNNPFLNPAFGVARGFESYDYEAGSDVETRRADVMVDRALAWIDARSERPFFLVIHLFDPHMNYDPPADTRGRFTSALGAPLSLPVGDTPRLREHARSIPPPARRFIAAAYDEEIAFVDEQTARFLRALEKRGLTGHTLVLYTADHGEELFDHESFGHGHTQFQEQLHVPLIALGAGAVPARVEVPVSIADVAPTVLEATGLEADDAMQGRSLWPAMTGHAAPDLLPVFAERTGAGTERVVVIDWPHKLIRDLEVGSTRLFDLAADPEERIDLAGERPERRAVLEEQLRLALPGPRGDAAPAGVDLDAATREKLRALGYLE